MFAWLKFSTSFFVIVQVYLNISYRIFQLISRFSGPTLRPNFLGSAYWADIALDQKKHWSKLVTKTCITSN